MRGVAAASLVFVLGLSMTIRGAAQTIERVNVNADGVEANGESVLHLFDGVSSDGRLVVFTSAADNLVPGDANGLADVFVRDRLAGTITRVSVSTSGGDPSAESSYPSISEDGHWIAFSSSADNLVPNDTNGVEDVFVYDVETRLIARISLSWDGGEADGYSHTPSISGDGRYVTFGSGALNLVPGPPVWAPAIYVRDLLTGVNEIVSVAWDGGPEDGNSWYPHISAEGRHVAFVSNSTNIVPNDGNGENDVFIRELDLGVTTRVSVDLDGNDPDGRSGGFGISADGRFVGIFSQAPDMVTGDTNDVGDAFVRDLDLAITERVSVSSAGDEGNDGGGWAMLDGSGRYAAFHSESTNLVSGDLNGFGDVFSRDRSAGTTVLLSISASGTQGDDASRSPTLSADGRFVVFSSSATNLVPADGNGFVDIFIAYGPATPFADGFEAGDTSRWSLTVP